MDLSNLSVKDLKDLIERAQKRIGEVEKIEFAEVRQQVIEFAKSRGYDAMQLLAGAGAKVSEKVRRPAKPKYKDPKSDATWTGRGLKPKWMVAALQGGHTLESLEIK